MPFFLEVAAKMVDLGPVRVWTAMFDVKNMLTVSFRCRPRTGYLLLFSFGATRGVVGSAFLTTYF